MTISLPFIFFLPTGKYTSQCSRYCLSYGLFSVLGFCAEEVISKHSFQLLTYNCTWNMLSLLHDKCWCFVSIISSLAHDGLSHDYHCAHFPDYTSEKLGALPKYSAEPKLLVCFRSSCFPWYSELQGWGLRLRSPLFVLFCFVWVFEPGFPMIQEGLKLLIFIVPHTKNWGYSKWFLWMHVYRAELSSSSFHFLLSVFFALTYTMIS